MIILLKPEVPLAVEKILREKSIVLEELLGTPFFAPHMEIRLDNFLFSCCKKLRMIKILISCWFLKSGNVCRQRR